MERKNLLPVIIFTLAASWLPDILAGEIFGMQSIWLRVAKAGILAAAAAYYEKSGRSRSLAKYLAVLAAVVSAEIGAYLVDTAPWWRALFDYQRFIPFFGSSILLKSMGALPVAAVLLLLYKNPREVYLVPGDWHAKASRIRWLGIDGGRVSWGRLSVISAVLISLGTLLLTLITVTGFSLPAGAAELPRYLPVIAGFALVNSFCEGLVYRNAVLGPLKDILPKDQIILTAAVFFGIAHYRGAPGGIIGVVMSSLLGWYMCRSMYESRGFLPPWIIHFLQDVVIFTAIFLLGGFLL